MQADVGLGAKRMTVANATGKALVALLLANSRVRGTRYVAELDNSELLRGLGGHDVYFVCRSLGAHACVLVRSDQDILISNKRKKQRASSLALLLTYRFPNPKWVPLLCGAR